MNSTPNHLNGARVYLSGPMDFVASRVDEKKLGWRNRIGDFLRSFGSTVFDPWFKPAVRGLHEYGLKDIHTIDVRTCAMMPKDSRCSTHSQKKCRSNPIRVASQAFWYMPLVGGDSFFDGFGFAGYIKRFQRGAIPMDEQERRHPPKNPLLPYLEKIAREVPKRWYSKLKQYIPNDDWLLWDLQQDR